MTPRFIGRITGASLVVLMTVACTPTDPQGGAGVGFSDYNSYIRGSAPPPAGPAAPPVGGAFDPAAAAAAIDRADGTAPAPACPRRW